MKERISTSHAAVCHNLNLVTDLTCAILQHTFILISMKGHQLQMSQCFSTSPPVGERLSNIFQPRKPTPWHTARGATYPTLFTLGPCHDHVQLLINSDPYGPLMAACELITAWTIGREEKPGTEMIYGLPRLDGLLYSATWH